MTTIEYETATRFMFIGCSKTKCPKSRLLKTPEELYQGELFRKRVLYAEQREMPWYALSARYGLCHPNSVFRWYDETFASQCKLDRAAWAPGVATAFLSQFDDDSVDPRSITVELHAGKNYCAPLAGVLTLCGFTVETPVAGLAVGQQESYYKQRLECFGENTSERYLPFLESENLTSQTATTA